MLQEQNELRSFITALRGASEVSSADLAKDIKGLATRLARHWGIALEVSAQHRNVMIPARLYLDLQQIVREAVANAVRHADTKSMSIELSAERSQLRVGLTNDGKPYPKRGDYVELPQSLRERVIAAGGDLDISRGMGVTLLSVTLPIGAKR
jgi:signal transduction histidine kinase